MPNTFGSRLKHAWNAFSSGVQPDIGQYGTGDYYGWGGRPGYYAGAYGRPGYYGRPGGYYGGRPGYYRR